MGALVETVLGLRAKPARALALFARKPHNPDASSWFRKHGRSILEFGRKAGYASGGGVSKLPLISSPDLWRLSGSLVGGHPLVFVSRRVHEELGEFSEHGPGWLLGQQGSWAKTRWYYIDRLVPSYARSICPDGAVGVFHGSTNRWRPEWRAAEPPLLVEARDGSMIIRTGPASESIEGYFVRDNRRSGSGEPQQRQSSVTPPYIKVGPANGRSEAVGEQTSEVPQSSMGGEELVHENSGRLRHLHLELPECTYCGTACAPDEEWEVCVQCETLVHRSCEDELGGCAYTACPRSPLHAD